MRLLQRFAVEPAGMRFLVDLRAELLPGLKGDRRLLALDAELEQLFSTWFDVAFLELRRIDWNSPASLIEKLIRYEAVHDIKSWNDVKNRLDDSDRRCYGFFHPRLPNEPLIFVEVALVDRVSDGITPLLDETAVPVPPARATTAIFYSISNTQNGLRGVSFGDSLIKRVVETLQDELPRLKTFATLSPIPGFRTWLAKNAPDMTARLDEKRAAEIGRLVGSLPPTPDRLLAAVDAAAADLGGLDGVVVATGVPAFGPAMDTDPAVAEELFAVNTLGPMALVRAASRHLDGGVVVVLSAILADLPTNQMAEYSASKSALSAWLGVVRRENRRRFHVVDVRPPHLDTGLSDRGLAGTPPRLPEPLAGSVVIDRVLDAIRADASEVVWDAKAKEVAGMHRLTIEYTAPADVEAFEAHYRDVHVPL
eukprot:gene30194-34081_t